MSEYIYATNGKVMGDEDGLISIPREEIVRCRDCKYYIEDTDPIDPGWPMMCADSGRDMLEPYGFCAWGERRD